jgi:spore coat protein CotH
LENNIISDEVDTVQDTSQDITITGVISEIRSASIDGNTVYYLKLQDDDTYYTISAKDDQNAVILNVGNTITFTCSSEKNAMIAIKSMKIEG